MNAEAQPATEPSPEKRWWLRTLAIFQSPRPVFAALRDGIRRSGADPGTPGEPDDRLAARAEAERLWPVSADRPLRLRPGVRGGIGTPVKAVLKKTLGVFCSVVLRILTQVTFITCLSDLTGDIRSSFSLQFLKFVLQPLQSFLGVVLYF